MVALRAVTQLDELRTFIRERWRVAAEFALSDIIREFGPKFASRHPANAHPEAKLRQLAQRLPDEGTLAFVDNEGTYRRLA